ncbi:peptidylprolyl isomerase [Pacificoceanicola onchidii]|uniref:peptidylprolyl isomerase n=1 Tax=Pacificoceanicola onchidii TaxID=2562685 RepID=UPI0010A6B3A8|nr:peptidylprolyl isomerase [Pacificoceanicola onchidii]
MAAKSGNTTKTLGLILIGVLVLGLGGFGVTNFSGHLRAIGSVGEAEIPVNDYARALQNEIRAVEAQFGTPVTFQQAQSLGLPQRVLSQMVVTAALENEAGELGISVGDENLAEQLRNIRAFQGPDGSFNRVAYQATLDNVGLSERDFEAQLRAQSAATVLQGAVLAGTKLPDTYIETLASYAGERRAFTWAEITAEGSTIDLPEPSDDELKAWYQENIARFTVPETKVITYAWVTPEMIVDTVEVDEATLRAAYDEREAEFNLPERRLVERLVFADDAEATAALERLTSAEISFEALVEERGLDLADTDLGDVTRDALEGAAETVFAAEVGDIAGPAPTPLGPALFRINAVLPANETPFEEAAEALRDTLALDRARRVIDGMAQGLDDEMAAGATLEELADSTDLELGTIDWTTLSDDGIAGYDAFRAAAASVTEEDYPAIDQLGDGGIYALRLNEVRAPAPQPFEDVTEDVRAGWTQEAQTIALVEEGKSIAEDIAGGQTFQQLGLEARSEEGLSRTAQLPDLPAALLSEAFDLGEGEAVSLPGTASAYILRLDRIIGADMNSPEIAQLNQLFGDQAANDVAQDLFQALSTDIQTRAGVSIDQQAINAVHANFQ